MQYTFWNLLFIVPTSTSGSASVARITTQLIKQVLPHPFSGYLVDINKLFSVN